MANEEDTMGLDMYLSARRSAYAFSGPKELSATLTTVADAFLPPDAGNIGFQAVEREAAYWRKANQIHAWFVANVQDGVDECQRSTVELAKLIELRDLCVGLLAKRDPDEAMAKLPPQEGFFFGSTEMDDYYWSDVEDTANQLNRIINWHEAAGVSEYDVEYIYRASW